MWVHRFPVAVVAAVVGACTPPPDDTPATCHGLVAGDLVITEVFADHAGTGGASGIDDGHEWIELASAASGPVELGGVALVHSRVDGSRERRASLAGGSLEPGGYHVVGSAAAGELPAHVDDGIGPALGDLANRGGGRLAILCGAIVVDEITYGDARAGRSLQLDGGSAPDYATNDDPARWCHAADGAFADGNHGTPGEANRPCATAMPDGLCAEGGSMRAPVAPGTGDLRITEVMPNPDGPDGAAEWVELRATRDVDLNGVIVGRDPARDDHRTTLTADACLRVPAGGHAVIARSADAMANGGLPAPLATMTVGLLNRDGQIFVAAPGGAVLDVLSWAESDDGVSIQRAPGDGDQRCPGAVRYGPGGHGTPGAAADCGPCAEGCAGFCVDGDERRAILPPRPGQLRIVEWMANPEGLPDSRGEYLEVLAMAAIDLNGVALGKALDEVEAPIAPAHCLSLGYGERAVFAHDGGDVSADGRFRFALPQSNGRIVIAHAGEVIDDIEYESSTAGRATIIDDRGQVCAIAAEPRHRYNGTDHGTPGSPNPRCPP